ncbi:hypothetical protein QTH91_11505 [Variovorax dokdonensis]|uniref:Uncharacterized protein n=1 Tax=Variovorax dokdonensis TaxID=344883 RepID=A0ABT7NB69_9BURK|nr:hypothetical protein [Variovorax dokdonensis]MDM0045110.1 hypothetical protein [Variovorax dokdonensis]
MNAVTGRSNLSLDGAQMRRVIELLELHAESPTQAQQLLNQMVQGERLPASQHTAIAALFALGNAQADRALNAACADDEAVECLLQLRTHEARLEYVGGARRSAARTRAAA